MKSLPLGIALFFLAACGGSPSTPKANSPTGADAGTTPTKTGKTFESAADAPKYSGTSFQNAQIFDLEANVYLDEAALLEAFDDVKLVFFGEQHETAPVQELELWVLERAAKRYDDLALAMEHFQHDEQPVLDKYIAGDTSTADFEKKSDPWPNYAKFWKPLVEHQKSLGRPVVGLNVPEEALEQIYAAYPKTPLEVFNSWTSSFQYSSSIAPRPLSKWDATYKSYFEASFDYEAHGKNLGLSRADALNYFTDLAHIRDETMAYFVAKTLEGGAHVLVVAGDWHVQTALATPDRVVRYRNGDEPFILVTTTPVSKFDALKTSTVSGRKPARFVFVYE